MIRLPAEGESFGRYRLTRQLGQGGMGVVYAAHDTTLDRDVAVKLVTPQYAADAGFRARFKHEAATLAKLESPHVVTIHDHGEQDGVLYLVTQLISGGDLHGMITRQGALPPAVAVSVIDQVALALVDAHAVGVVHRDIKPANVLLRGRGAETQAFLCDFGIATTPGADLSRTGTVAGSLPYMAPERHKGENSDVTGDVYAVGCLLWHALTGSAPYAGTDVEVAMGHIQGPIPQLPGKDDFSVSVNGVLRRSLAKDPRKRLSTAQALHAELARALQLAPDAVALPGSTSFRQALDGEGRRRRWFPGLVAAAATGAVLLGTLVAAGALDLGEPSPAADSRLGPAATTAADSKAINEPPTLLPVDSTRDVDDWAPGEVAEPGEVPGLVQAPRRSKPTADEEPARPRERTSSRPSKKSSPRPDPTTVTPTPVNHYRCWNGDEVPDYSDCTRPLGWTGANYIFQDISKLSGCRVKSDPDSNKMVEAWGCRYTAGGTHKNWVTIARWKNVSSAKTYYRSWFRSGRSMGPWIRNDRRFGMAMSGRKGDGRFSLVRVYENEPWTVSVNAANKTARKRFFDRFQHYRYPNWLRGYKYQ